MNWVDAWGLECSPSDKKSTSKQNSFINSFFNPKGIYGPRAPTKGYAPDRSGVLGNHELISSVFIAVSSVRAAIAVRSVTKGFFNGLKGWFGKRGRRGMSATINSACFTGDTLIKTEKGNRPIKTVQVGDKVYSKNTNTGEQELKKVVKVFIHDVRQLVYLKLSDDNIIKTTPERPFWVVGKGFIEVKNLKVNDKLLLYSNKKVKIKDIFSKNLDKTIQVYNFEVADWHTYYVTDKSILVHNKAAKLNRSLNKIKDSFLKKKGINAHLLKKDTLGKKSKISKYDLYIDKATKEIIILEKGGKGVPIPTGEFLK